MSIVKRHSDKMKNLSQFFYGHDNGMVSLNQGNGVEANHMKIFHLEDKTKKVSSGWRGSTIEKNIGQSFAFAFYFTPSDTASIIKPSWKDENGVITEGIYQEEKFKLDFKAFTRWIKETYPHGDFKDSMIEEVKKEFFARFLTDHLFDKEKESLKIQETILKEIDENSSFQKRKKEINERNTLIEDQRKRYFSNKEIASYKKQVDDIDEQLMILNKIRDDINKKYRDEIKSFYKAENKASGVSHPYDEHQSGLEHKQRSEIESFKMNIYNISNKYLSVYGESLGQEIKNKIIHKFSFLFKK